MTRGGRDQRGHDQNGLLAIPSEPVDPHEVVRRELPFHRPDVRFRT
jgi:hypothetical protein